MYTLYIFNLILVLCAVFAFCAENAKKVFQRQISRIIVFLVMFIPAAIRYGIGTDYFNYVFLYHNSEYDFRSEVGFLFFNKILAFWELDVQWFFVISSFFIYGLVCFGIPRKNYFLHITFYVLLCYLSSYSVIRQSICVAFLLVALLQYLEGHLKKYYISVILACLFHYSGFLVLLLTFFAPLKMKRGLMVPLFILLVFLVYRLNLIEFFFNSDLFIESRYGDYAMSSFYRKMSMGSGVGILIKIMLPVLVIWFSPVVIRQNSKNNFIVILCYAYVFFYFLVFKIYIFQRLINLLIMMPVIVAPLIINVSPRLKKICIILFITLNIITYEKDIVSGRINQGGLGINPYSTIFNK